MTDVSAIDAEKSVIGFDATIQGRDGVIKNLHDEDSWLRTASTDPDTKMLARLSLQGDLQHFLISSKSWVVGAAWSSILFNPLSVDSKTKN